MYISLFWIGVWATLLSEVLLLTFSTIISEVKRNKSRKKEACLETTKEAD